MCLCTLYHRHMSFDLTYFNGKDRGKDRVNAQNLNFSVIIKFKIFTIHCI